MWLYAVQPFSHNKVYFRKLFIEIPQKCLSRKLLTLLIIIIVIIIITMIIIIIIIMIVTIIIIVIVIIIIIVVAHLSTAEKKGLT